MARLAGAGTSIIKNATLIESTLSLFSCSFLLPHPDFIKVVSSSSWPDSFRDLSGFAKPIYRKCSRRNG